MALKDLWKLITKKSEVPQKKIFLGKSDEEKQLELEERRNEAELNRLKINEAKRARFKKELEDLHAEIVEDDNEDYEEVEESDDIPPYLKPFMPFIVQKLGAVASSQNSGLTSPDLNFHPSPPQPQVSDIQLREFLDSLPKSQLEAAKKTPKPMLYSMVNQQMPMSQHDFERGYQILVSEY